MNYKITVTPGFEKELKKLSKKYSSMREDYQGLLSLLGENPFSGTAIGRSCYKIRLAITSKGKGKRGGARAITYVYVKAETVYLLFIYDKSDKENITDEELHNILATLK